MGTSAARPVRAHADDYFFSAMALLIAATVFIGFARTYFMAGMLHAKLPSPLVHVHGALFSTWILLLIAQIALVFSGRVNWHMQLGIFGMVVASLMVIVGFATLIAALRRSAFGSAAGIVSVYDTLSLLLFAALVLWAFLVRTNGPAHKRLILLATIAILAPALTRWPYAFLENIFVFFAVLDLFLLFMIAYDLWSSRRIHTVTICATLLIVLQQLIYSPIARSAFLHNIIVSLQNR